MKNTIAITNQKGGVGKSTTAQALAEGLRCRGFSVLTVDTDPQGNLSFSMGADISDEALTIYDVLKGRCKAEEAIQHTEQGDVIAANVLLAGAELEFTQTGREYRLRRALEKVADRYDYIVIDTPPSLGLLTANAYTAADRLIVPMVADIFSLQGIYQLRDAVDQIREYCNPEIRIDGLLVTKYSSRANVRRGMKGEIEALAEEIGCKLYGPIREAAAVLEAQASQQGLRQYAAGAKVAADYAAFVDKFLEED